MVYVNIICDNSFQGHSGQQFKVSVYGYLPRVKDLKDQIKSQVYQLQNIEIDVKHNGYSLDDMDMLDDIYHEDDGSINLIISKKSAQSGEDCIVM